MLDIELDDELRRKAHRSMAGQAAAGVALYPLLCLIFGHAAALTERQPLLFFPILGAVVLASALRGLLVLRFDPLYRRSPRRWERLHTGSVLASALAWTAISSWAVLEHGLTGVTSFGLLASAILCNMALVVYAPSLLLVRRFLIAVLAPHLAVFLLIGGDARRLIAPLTVVYGLYLWNAANRLERNYWQGPVRRPAAGAPCRGARGGAGAPGPSRDQLPADLRQRPRRDPDHRS